MYSEMSNHFLVMTEFTGWLPQMLSMSITRLRCSHRTAPSALSKKPFTSSENGVVVVKPSSLNQALGEGKVRKVRLSKVLMIPEVTMVFDACHKDGRTKGRCCTIDS